MDSIYADSEYLRTLTSMEYWLARMEQLVPPPEQINTGDSFKYRYSEQTLEQALVQKLARMVTALHSARLLLNNGLFQDQASIQRMLDEFEEDIMFLAYAPLFDEITNRHKDFLEAFYEEEFDDPENPLDSTQKRPSIPRQKIRAYISNIGAKLAAQDAEKDQANTENQKDEEGLLANPSAGIEAARTLSKLYSGYLHGASPQIMDMYAGTPPKFNVSGMLRTPREETHREDLWSQFYRGVTAFGLVASVLGDQGLNISIEGYRIELEKTSGMWDN